MIAGKRSGNGSLSSGSRVPTQPVVRSAQSARQPRAKSGTASHIGTGAARQDWLRPLRDGSLRETEDPRIALIDGFVPQPARVIATIKFCLAKLTSVRFERRVLADSVHDSNGS